MFGKTFLIRFNVFSYHRNLFAPSSDCSKASSTPDAQSSLFYDYLLLFQGAPHR
ncbi:hypothetical protein [Bradyrhizobium brasilense]|uniref:hypothetical protein n=1 Tax=Bradyrhizobium brasilense TaxID=1419277 RepID=UPI001E5F3216|nr:hypothetical protein [Bradyrhizobium brasilense]MCC8968975.1 hypothetical protein [Bradyrhizobium brasilense]